MKLVIFSYSNHFNIMQLAHKHAITAIDNIDEVVVVWDDMFAQGDSREEITNNVLTVIPASRIIFHSDITCCIDEPLGWLRQQYIKLNLHNILGDDSWIILDADVVLQQKKNFVEDQTVLFYTDGFDYYQPYFDFIKYAFDLDKKQSPSYMTHFALFERSVLDAIESYCLRRHGVDLVTLFKNFYRPLKSTTYAEPMTPPLSEFEIYGLFCERILAKPIKCVENVIPNSEPKEFCLLYEQGVDSYYQGVDQQLDQTTWQTYLKNSIGPLLLPSEEQNGKLNLQLLPLGR